MKRYSSTPCDARCLYATGHDCTCSCGGRNHGRGAIPSLMLPGMEDVPAARAHASSIALGASLTERMRETRSVAAVTGMMEIHSPLFRNSPANPQGSLLNTAMIDAAGDELTDLWNF